VAKVVEVVVKVVEVVMEVVVPKVVEVFLKVAFDPQDSLGRTHAENVSVKKVNGIAG